jgi:hypothetical protein
LELEPTHILLQIVALAVLGDEQRGIAVVSILFGLEGLVVEASLDMALAKGVAGGTTPLEGERALRLARTNEAAQLVRDVLVTRRIATLVVDVYIRS